MAQEPEGGARTTEMEKIFIVLVDNELMNSVAVHHFLLFVFVFLLRYVL